MRRLIERFMRRVAPKQARPAAATTPGTGASARVLVCGASGSIGAAVAKAFVAQGAAVYLHAHRRGDLVERLVADLRRTYGKVEIAHSGIADLCDGEAARRLVLDASAALGGLDVVVAAVGHARDAPLPLINEADIEDSMRNNLLPVINLCEAFREHRAASPQSAAIGGRLVVVSSVTGLVGQPMRLAYGAAKGAVISYVKSLAREVAPLGITANLVAPQVVDGGLADLMKAHVRKLLLANTPVGRACTSDDVAHAVTSLAAPGASFITGTVLSVSGGLITW